MQNPLFLVAFVCIFGYELPPDSLSVGFQQLKKELF